MDKGWEVDEEHYLENLIANPLWQKRHENIEKPAVVLAQQSPKTRMRFRTTSMPKLEEMSKPSSPNKQSKAEPAKQSPTIKTPIRQQKFQIYPQRISLKSTLFNNPIEDSSPIKIGRTLQLKQFNPLQTLKNTDTHYSGMRGQTRSVKSASMSYILNDDRIINKKKIEDFVFKLRPQRNASIIYVNSQSSLQTTTDDIVLRKMQK